MGQGGDGSGMAIVPRSGRNTERGHTNRAGRAEQRKRVK
jgi:hypothetical protein